MTEKVKALVTPIGILVCQNYIEEGDSVIIEIGFEHMFRTPGIFYNVTIPKKEIKMYYETILPRPFEEIVKLLEDTVSNPDKFLLGNSASQNIPGGTEING